MQSFRIFFLILALLLSQPSCSGLPTEVDGKPLPSLAPMLEKVTPAVVNISTTSNGHQGYTLELDPFFRQFRLPRRKRTSHSLGSGVIIDAEKGYLVTNYHVVKEASVIQVILSNGIKHRAKLLGYDQETDIALLEIHADKLTALTFADSDLNRVGDFVIAIGNPFGLGQTVTSGIISALGRTNLGIEGYEDFIQTDASINPGNSGGALVNLNGQLIGVNTAILAPSGGNIGIGFAIPSNMVNAIIVKLARYGRVRRGEIGIKFEDVNETVGALVTHVIAGSPAEKSGLKPGDIVIELNKKAIKTAADMHNTIGLLSINQVASMIILRKGRAFKIKTYIVAPEAVYLDGAQVNPHFSGAKLSSIAKSYESGQGVLIHEVDEKTPAAYIGLHRGDVIISANHQVIDSLPDLQQALQHRGSFRVRIKRGNSVLLLLIQ